MDRNNENVEHFDFLMLDSVQSISYLKQASLNPYRIMYAPGSTKDITNGKTVACEISGRNKSGWTRSQETSGLEIA